MNYLNFLEQSDDIGCFENNVISCFGKVYPLLFFAYVAECLKKNKKHIIQALDMDQLCTRATSTQLSSSFLGSRYVYWLKNFSEMDAKKQAHWTRFIQDYNGPHCLFLFSEKPVVTHANNGITIELPDQLDLVASERILKSLICSENVSHVDTLITALFKARKYVSFDMLILMARYARIAGSDFRTFLDQWLDIIILPEISLFDLSKYFFARNKREFFSLWEKLGPRYGQLFWTAYWSDLMWRAYNFIRLSSSGHLEQAKKIGSRLPFSFLKNDWRKINVNTIKNSLDYLYKFDCDVKSGEVMISDNVFLELWYLKFFTDQW